MNPRRFAFAPTPTLSLRHLGRESEPLVQLDGVLADPAQLIERAAEEVFMPAYGPQGGYPGLRAPAPLDYVEMLARLLLPIIRDAYALGAVRLARAECNFSLVTLPPDALVPSQSAPHVDTSSPLQFAILHYLCEPEFGGTAFFRHRATGYETISQDRQPIYDSARAAEMRGRAPQGYVTDDNPWFERIGLTEARRNRLVIYRSHLLHSGVICAPERLSPDPRRGRLTANIFLTLRPDDATTGH